MPVNINESFYDNTCQIIIAILKNPVNNHQQ